MKIIADITIFFNLILLLVLTIGLCCKFENPKIKANFGYTMVGSIILCLLGLSLIALLDLFRFKYQTVLFLAPVIFSPFIIGKLVVHDTIKKYTFIQILCFLFSFAYLIYEYCL